MADASSSNLADVKRATHYKIADGTLGQQSVLREDLARAYHYGSTIVPISESDQNVTMLETVESFTIIGFVPEDKVEEYRKKEKEIANREGKIIKK